MGLISTSLFFVLRITDSMHWMKSVQDSASPCLTPLLMRIGSESWLFTFTLV